MKSVKELFQDYSFSQAKQDLEILIEKDFKQDHIVIPPVMLKCFSLNPLETKKLFGELEELGYRIIFCLNQQVIIKISDATHIDLLKSLISNGLNRLLDNRDAFDLLVKLAESRSSQWKFKGMGDGRDRIYLYDGYKIHIVVNTSKKYFVINRSSERFELSDREASLLESIFSVKSKAFKRDHELKQLSIDGISQSITVEDYVSPKLSEELKYIQKLTRRIP
jgi:hypothetical protein